MTCAACGNQNRAAARFCDSCGAPLTAPAEEARKTVTVVFADLVGSTALQETLDPETARRVIERFTAAMAEVVEEHAGRVVKTMGDGLMAAFGIPTVGEDDAARAVCAGVAMHERLAALNEDLARERGVRLRMRVGANTGEVVVGADGDAVGDAVNVAARLESAAPPGGVLVGEQTYWLVRDTLALEELEPLDVRGKAERQRAWLVTGGLAPASEVAETPFVARDAELARLGAALDAAQAAGAARLVTVIGSPGMGKSRLAREFVAQVAAPARAVEGRCEPAGEGITFMPVADVLRALAGIDESDAPATAHARLAALLPEEDRDRAARLAAGMLGVAEAGLPEEAFWAIRRVLEAVAAEQPLVVVFDDVHWGQPQFLDLVEHLAGWATGAPLLLLLLARPELRDVRPELCERGRLVTDVVELDALDQEASRALVAGLLGGEGAGQLAPAVADRLLETTEGNPLFLGETVRMLVEDGALRREDGRWAVHSDRLDVPPTINALLAARIERLDVCEREVVERAAVIGKSFYRGAVAALAEPEVAAGLDDHLEALRRREMVEPEGTFWIDEPVFRFHHVLIRDAAYRGLLKEARAELHESFADWLVEKTGERMGEFEEVVAYHLEQAHEYRRQLGPLDERGRALGQRAATHFGASGRRALAREDLAAAANLLERALVRGSEDAELLVDLVEVRLSGGDAAGGEAALERLDLVAGDDDRLRARMSVAGVELGRLTGEIGLREAERELAYAADALAAAGDDAGHAKALELLARSIAPLGRIAEAEAVLDRALAAARRAGDQRRVTSVLSTAPIVALYGPSPVPRASGRCLDVVRILRMGQGNRHVEARALRCQAVLEAMRGRAEAAHAILAGARATFEELGLRLDLLELGVYAAMVELLLENADAAERELRATADGLEALGASGALAYALLARALVVQGREDEALEATDAAEVRAGDDVQATALLTRVRAEALTGRDVEEAERLARQAIALVEPTDALAEHADCRLALARVLRAGGRKEEAAAEATRAAELYAAKGHEVGVRWAAQLGGASAPARERPSALVAWATPPAPRPQSFADSVPVRVYAAIQARDWDTVRQFFARGFVGEDRRAVGQPIVRGPEETVQMWRNIVVSDPVIDVEILDGDARTSIHRVRIHGIGPKGFGPFEFEHVEVSLFEGDRTLRTTGFDSAGEPAARARFDELQATPTAELLYREWFERFRERDWDGLLALYAEEYISFEHRKLGWEAGDRASHVEHLRSGLEICPDLDADATALDADDHTLLAHARWRGHARDGGGTIEYDVLDVLVFREGLCARDERFGPEDEEAAWARLAELRAPSEDRGPTTRVYERSGEAFAARDWDACAAILAPGIVVRDHRPVGGPTLYGREAAMESLRAAAGVADFEVRQVPIAHDGHALLARRILAGAAGEIELLQAVVVDGEQVVRLDLYGPEQKAEARARFELMRSRPMAATLLDEWAAALVDRDWDAVEAVFHDDFEFVDHRPVGWEVTRGKSVSNLFRSLGETFGGGSIAHEVLDGDDRAVLARLSWDGQAVEEGGGMAAFEVLLVTIQREGRVARGEFFALEDEPAARARLAELISEPADRRPAVQLFERAQAAFRNRDWEAYAACFAPGTLLVNRSPLSDPPVRGREGLVQVMREIIELSPDSRWNVEVLAATDRAALMRLEWTGRGGIGGTQYDWAHLQVAIVHEREFVRGERFAVRDLEAARARYEELRERPLPAVLTDEWVEGILAGDWDALQSLYPDEFELIDHRPVGWGAVRGDGLVDRVRSIAESIPEGIEVWHETLDGDDRAILDRFGWRGHAAEHGGGPADSEVLQVVVQHGGRFLRAELFEPDDEAAARARLAELRTGAFAPGAAARAYERARQAFATRDWNAYGDCFAEGAVLIDRSTFGDPPLIGRQAFVEQMQAIVALAPDTRWEIEVLAATDRCVLARQDFTGHGGAAESEYEWAHVHTAVVHDGRFVRVERFAPRELALARARYEEVSARRIADLLDEETIAAINARDWLTLRSLFADDWTFADRRAIGSEPMRGPDDAVALLRSVVQMFVPEDCEVTPEWLAGDDRVRATREIFTGTAVEGGGPLRFVAFLVREQRGGQWIRIEQFDTAEGARARCEELMRAAPSALGRAAMQLLRRFIDASNSQDWGAIREIANDDATLTDYRAGLAGTYDVDGFVARQERTAEVMPAGRLELELEEVVEASETHAVWRWALSSDDDVVISQTAAVVIRDGRMWRAGIWEAGQVEEARAWSDLVRAVVPGDLTPVFAGVVAWIAAVNRRDWAAMRALWYDDARFVDHTRVGRGRLVPDELIASIRELVELAPYLRHVARDVLFADDAHILARIAYEGGGGAPIELEWLMVGRIVAGRIAGTEAFDLDDEGSAWARLVELGADPAAVERVRVERESLAAPGIPPTGDALRLHYEYVVAANLRDVEKIRSLLSDDFVVHDHRPVSAQVFGRDEQVERMRVLDDLMPGLHLRLMVREWLHVADSFYVVRYAFEGVDADGARTEWEGIARVVSDAMHTRSFDFYDVDDRERAVAGEGAAESGALEDQDDRWRYGTIRDGADVERARALTITSESLPHLSPDAPLFRAFVAALAGINGRDEDLLASAYAPGFVFADHRKVGWGDISADEHRARIRTLIELSPDVRFELGDALAANESSVLTRAAWRGTDEYGSDFAIDLLLSFHAAPDGFERIEAFDVDDEAAASARFAKHARAWATVADAMPDLPPEAPAFRTLARFLAAVAARDWELLLSAYAPGSVVVDRRPVGWGEITPSGHVERIRGLAELSPDVQLVLREPRVVGERGGLTRFAWVGSSHEQGGEFVIELLVAWFVGDEGLERIEMFEPEDEQAAQARYAQLVEDRHERSLQTYLEAFAARDLDRMLRELVTEDVEIHDHRPFGQPPARGLEEYAHLMRVMFSLGPELAIDAEVVASDGDWSMMRYRFHGISDELGAGDSEVVAFARSRLRGERTQRMDWYEDEESARAAFEEARAIAAE